MGFRQHVTRFAGKPVKDYQPGQGLKNPVKVIYRVRLSWEEAEDEKSITDILGSFLDESKVDQVPGLVIGSWTGADDMEQDSGSIVEALVAARDRLPNLRALFIGDVTQEECEVSWLQQSDLSPLLTAFPRLEHLQVRGGSGLSFGTLRHGNLQTLVVESGGLGAEVIREVARAKLPRLEHLELWLGDPSYGGIENARDLKPLLTTKGLPALKYLGLRDSAIADQVATAVAKSPLVEHVRVLDLSLGNLTDQGVEALVASPAVARLEKLDIHHHFVSRQAVKKLKALGITVDARDHKEPYVFESDGEIWRYIAVAE